MTYYSADRASTGAPLGGTDDDESFAFTALRIVLFSIVAVIAISMAFAFFWPAVFVLGAIVAWRGFDGIFGPHRNFALRALAMICFAVFAVVTVALSIVALPVAGVVLAAGLIWRGFGRFGAGARADQAAPQIQAGPAARNTAFDAYRRDMMQRLEDEQDAFDQFLARLRDAKDSREFDRFFEERVRAAHAWNDPDPEAYGRR